MSNKKYIYSYKLANFLIQEGCNVLETGIYNSKIYWMFDYNEVQPAYGKWLKTKPID